MQYRTVHRDPFTPEIGPLQPRITLFSRDHHINLSADPRAHYPLEAHILASPCMRGIYETDADFLDYVACSPVFARQLARKTPVWSSSVPVYTKASRYSDARGARVVISFKHTGLCGKSYQRSQTVRLVWHGTDAPAEIECPFCLRREDSLVRTPTGPTQRERIDVPLIGEYACRGCAGLAYTMPLPEMFAAPKRPGRKSQVMRRAVEREMRELGAEIRRMVAAGEIGRKPTPGRPKQRRAYDGAGRAQNGCAGRVEADSAYCVACRKSQPLGASSAAFTTRNGRSAMRGECPDCGRTICRLGQAI